MAGRLHELYTELWSKAIEDDWEVQRYYLSMVEEHRHISVDYLLQLGALFIPNNDYIRHYLGDAAITSNCGLYYQDVCPWTLFVVIPIRDLSGEITGIVGWDAYNKYREISEGEQGLSAYKVSAKSVFAREKFFLTDVDVLQKQFDKNAIFVTDGVFDTVALTYRGLPSIALLGSSFSPEVLYFLSWYSHVYVCADNDRAGVSLYNKLSRALKGVYRVKQAGAKDMEELLRTDGIDGPITKQLQSLIDQPISGDVFVGEKVKIRGR